MAGPWLTSLSLNDDGEYFARVILASHGIRFCPEARSYYRSGNRSSLSGRKSMTARLSQYQSIVLSCQYLLAAEDNSQTRLVCANLFQRFIYEVFPEVPSLRNLAARKVRTLGGSTERLIGGPLFQMASRLIGWEQARYCQMALNRYGYRWLALGTNVTQIRANPGSCYSRIGI